jgi:hypothetical protein
VGRQDLADLDRPAAEPALATDDPDEWTCLGDVYRVVLRTRGAG